LSQVVVTNDALKVEREKSRAQEKRISTDSVQSRWRRNTLKKKDPITVLIGLAVTPVVAIWAVLAACMVVPLKILEAVFKALGQMIGGDRSLITDKKL
jgi:hypothetical protein